MEKGALIRFIDGHQELFALCPDPLEFIIGVSVSGGQSIADYVSDGNQEAATATLRRIYYGFQG